MEENKFVIYNQLFSVNRGLTYTALKLKQSLNKEYLYLYYLFEYITSFIISFQYSVTAVK